MPTCTPIYGCPIPSGSDSPCTLGDTLCAFHECVDGQLDRLDAIVDRTFATSPMVEIASGDPQTFVVPSVPSPYNPVFDTVLSDTDNMADLTVNSSGFTATTGGIYYFWFTLIGSVTISAASSAAFDVQIVTNPALTWPGDSLIGSQYLPELRTGGLPLGNVGLNGGLLNAALPGTTYTLSLSINGTVGDTAVFTDIRFGAFYLGDLP